MNERQCPFYGARDAGLQEVDVDRFSVVCNECGAMGPIRDSEVDAFELWQHRVESKIWAR